MYIYAFLQPLKTISNCLHKLWNYKQKRSVFNENKSAPLNIFNTAYKIIVKIGEKELRNFVELRQIHQVLNAVSSINKVCDFIFVLALKKQKNTNLGLLQSINREIKHWKHKSV